MFADSLNVIHFQLTCQFYVIIFWFYVGEEIIGENFGFGF